MIVINVINDIIVINVAHVTCLVICLDILTHKLVVPLTLFYRIYSPLNLRFHSFFLQMSDIFNSR